MTGVAEALRRKRGLLVAPSRSRPISLGVDPPQFSTLKGQQMDQPTATAVVHQDLGLLDRLAETSLANGASQPLLGGGVAE